MKKMLLYIVLGIIVFMLLALFYLAFQSQIKAPPSLVKTKLLPCPQTPNCVCSEYSHDVKHYIQAIDMPVNRLAILKKIIQEMGGKLNIDTEYYLSATFTSTIFSFVDDIEIRFDKANQKAHIRSASRVGYSDMGENRKRLNLLKHYYQQYN